MEELTPILREERPERLHSTSNEAKFSFLHQKLPRGLGAMWGGLRTPLQVQNRRVASDATEGLPS